MNGKVYDNSNRGALFKNKKKEDGDKRPNYTGSLNVGGTDYWISAWLETSKAGERFMSLAVQTKDQVPLPKKATTADTFDDDLGDFR